MGTRGVKEVTNLRPEGSLHLHHQLQDHRRANTRPAARAISAEILEKHGPSAPLFLSCGMGGMGRPCHDGVICLCSVAARIDLAL